VSGTADCPVELETLPLIVREPATVRFGGRAFRIEREGLYRFADYDARAFRNVIYYGRDDFTLFASLCRIHVHGRADIKLSGKERDAAVLTRRLSIHCGPFHGYCLRTMQGLGLRVRRVQLLTLEDWNDYDNGHILLEHFHPEEGRWIALDLDTRSVFVDAAGAFMDTYQLTRAVREGKPYEIWRICTTDGSDHADPFDTFHEEVHLMEEGKRAWLRRIAQVPFVCETEVGDDGRTVYPAYYPYADEQVHERVEEYKRVRGMDFHGLPEAEWLERFYGGDE
jgi:hypothetical protein